MAKTIYSKDHKYIIEQLKKARKIAGLSQQRVAKLLKKGQSYVSKIESGQSRIDVVELTAFAKIYDKELSFFINGLG